MTRASLFLYLAVGLIALFARLHHIDFESFFMDEIHQATFYGQGFNAAVRGAIGQQQPPLDYLIGHIVFGINQSDVALRLPSALFGTGSVLLIMCLARRLLDGIKVPDLTAARVYIPVVVGLLAAIMPYPIYISQDIRPYSSAVFFFLLQLLLIDNVFRENSTGKKTYIALGLVTLAFLLSRTLSPLVVCLSHAIMLFFPWMLALRRDGLRGSKVQSQRFYAQLSMLLAFVVYSPLLWLIIASGQRFLRESTTIAGAWNFAQIGEAWIAQLEPLSLFHFALFLLGWLYTLKYLRKEGGLLLRLGLFLPVVSTLHFFIFSSMTNWPFRPPYSIYVFPVALLVGAVGAAVLMGWLKTNLSVLRFRLVLALVVAALLVPVSLATADFKSRRIKTDWRGFAEFAEGLRDAPIIWIAHTVTSEAVWNPDFYGWNRYPVSPADIISISTFIDNAEAREQLNGIQHKPALVLFTYRDYLLTSKSTIPVLPVPQERAVSLAGLGAHPAIHIEEFNGISVIFMKKNYGDTRQELYDLVTLLMVNNDEPALRTSFSKISELMNRDQNASEK